jgi:hypothetical protein
MLNLNARKSLKVALATVLVLTAVQAPAQDASARYVPFTPPATLEQAKLTIDAAELRFLEELRTPNVNPNVEQDFAILVQANTMTKLIDDPGDYLNYFRQNRMQLLAAAQVPGLPPINWQMLLAQTYLKYKIEKTKATENPATFISWLETVINHPYVQSISYGTWASLLFGYLVIRRGFSFAGGVAYGAMVAGPAAGAVNAGLNPIVTPVNQKLTVIGQKYIGPAGMWLNSKLFDGSATDSELKTASEAVEKVKAIVEGRSYELSNRQGEANRQVFNKMWNRLNYLFGLVPEAYRGGRDRMADLLILRQRDFAASATNSYNGAEVQRLAAENLLSRVINGGADMRAVEAAAAELYSGLEQHSRFNPNNTNSDGQALIENGKRALQTLGASESQLERIVSHYRNAVVFQRQAATFLAGQMIHDAMFADTIQGAREFYDTISRNTALSYLHGLMRQEIADIASELKFQIDARKELKQIEGTSKKNIAEKVTEKMKEIVGSREAVRALAEPGGLATEPAKTGEQRAREAATRALRR